MDKIEYPTKFVIDKVLTISLVNKKTGKIVYSAHMTNLLLSCLVLIP